MFHSTLSVTNIKVVWCCIERVHYGLHGEKNPYLTETISCGSIDSVYMNIGLYRFENMGDNCLDISFELFGMYVFSRPGFHKLISI